jgi:hypothetical protein
METGMTNLGTGGEAKGASEADKEPSIEVVRDETDERPVDQTGRGSTMETSMGANMDPDLMRSTGERSKPGGSAGSITVDDDLIGTPSPTLGAGQAAPYGETVENMPAPADPTEATDD